MKRSARSPGPESQGPFPSFAHSDSADLAGPFLDFVFRFPASRDAGACFPKFDAANLWKSCGKIIWKSFGKSRTHIQWESFGNRVWNSRMELVWKSSGNRVDRLDQVKNPRPMFTEISIVRNKNKLSVWECCCSCRCGKPKWLFKPCCL